jgi:hypothetical protein
MKTSERFEFGHNGGQENHHSKQEEICSTELLIQKRSLKILVKILTSFVGFNYSPFIVY